VHDIPDLLEDRSHSEGRAITICLGPSSKVVANVRGFKEPAMLNVFDLSLTEAT
jgi:hypothetical protein